MSKTKSHSDSESYSKTKSQPDSESHSDSESYSDSESQPDSESHSLTKSQPNALFDAQPQPDTWPQSNSMHNSSSDNRRTV
jgi:serine-aspartate repeat-containing protein C/D/E